MDMTLLAVAATLLTLAGAGQAVAGYLAVRRFRAGWRHDRGARPAVTVLKPLAGDEPLLEEALASVCGQDYPVFQVVFGVQNAADPALAVIERLQARFPACDIAVVVAPGLHGANRKISNLINMLPFAAHDVLVIADSDVHCPPDYLDRLVRTLAIPGTGLATTAYAGLAATPSLAGVLGASHISHSFLPGALMARWLGRQDCLGATMALRRQTLDAIGGLEALADHLADDHVLGKLVQGLGLGVRLADTFVATTVPETSLLALFSHELRWNRTVLALVPLEFALSSIQFPLFWAGLAILLSGGEHWALMLFLAAWFARGITVLGVDRNLREADVAGKTLLATPASIWLLPLRDLISMITLLASYCGDRVEWRGQVMHTGRGGAEPAARLPPPSRAKPRRAEIAMSPESEMP